MAGGLLGTRDKPAQARPAQAWVWQVACLLAAGDLNPSCPIEKNYPSSRSEPT